MTTEAGEPVVCQLAAEDDLPRIAEVFIAAFATDLEEIFGSLPDVRLVEEVFRLCRQVEPEALIAARRGENVLGYIYVPASTERLWRAAVADGYWWRLLRIWFESDRHGGVHPLFVLALDKFYFLRSAAEPGLDVDARVLSIAVAPEAQGAGVGTRLLRCGLDRLIRKGIGRVRLEVRPENRVALTVYRKLGFEVAGETEDTRGRWLIMIKKLE